MKFIDREEKERWRVRERESERERVRERERERGDREKINILSVAKNVGNIQEFWRVGKKSEF